MMEKIRKIIEEVKPTLVMIMVQIQFAAVDILYKLVAIHGFNFGVLIAYRHLFAAAFMLPVAIFVERRKGLNLTWTVVFQAFLCGLFGATLTQELYLRALSLISPSYARGATNLIPAITFLLAIISRLEKLEWSKPSGKAKVAGTILGLTGAMILTFYKGPSFDIPNPNVDLLGKNRPQSGYVARSHSDHVKGVVLTLLGCLSYSIWLILQSKMNERYPYPYSSIALMNIMAATQCSAYAYALSTERHWNEWKLGWNFTFFTAAFTGIFGSGVVSTMTAWCLQMRGPIFVSAFNPLALLPLLIAGFLLLDEKLHLGSLVGTVMIICGSYVVLWGKGKEMKEILTCSPAQSLKTSKPLKVESINYTPSRINFGDANIQLTTPHDYN